MSEESAVFDFEYEWKKDSHVKPIGKLRCLTQVYHTDVDDRESTAKGLGSIAGLGDAKPLKIYNGVYDALKRVVDDGKVYECPSYSGYVTSSHGCRVALHLAFQSTYGNNPAKWQNHNDELLARLYVDGNVEPIEEISILRRCTENPVRMGHYLDDTDQQRQLVWEALQDTDTYKMRVNYAQGKIDELSSLRLVISHCVLSRSRKTVSKPIEIDLVADASAKSEAGQFASTRLSHAISLTGSLPLAKSKKDNLGKRLRQKVVPEVDDVIPLVEFLFYYKSNDMLEALRLKENTDFIHSAPNATTATRQRKTQPEPVRLPPNRRPAKRQADSPASKLTEESPRTKRAKARTSIQDSTSASGAVQNQSRSTRSRPQRITASPSSTSPYVGQGEQEEQRERMSSSPLPDLPNHAQGRAIPKRSAADILRQSFAADQRRGQFLDPEVRPQPVVGPTRAPPKDSDLSAQGVLAKLFTNSGRKAPPNSLDILEEIGLIGTVGGFLEEQEEVAYKHRRLLASETYSKLTGAKWPAMAVVRLLTLLKMEDFDRRVKTEGDD